MRIARARFAPAPQASAVDPQPNDDGSRRAERVCICGRPRSVFPFLGTGVDDVARQTGTSSEAVLRPVGDPPPRSVESLPLDAFFDQVCRPYFLLSVLPPLCALASTRLLLKGAAAGGAYPGLESGRELIREWVSEFTRILTIFPKIDRFFSCSNFNTIFEGLGLRF